jgi:molecular chaperone GrpE
MQQSTPNANHDEAKAPAQDAPAERDRMLRALADAENARRWAERRAEESRTQAVAEFARGALEVADNLSRAIAAGDEPAGRASLLEGVKATERMLSGLLERFGIRKLETLGAAFNPEHHEAVMQTEDPRYEPGRVAAVMEEGYTIDDRLLRPARVVVAKAGSDMPAGREGGS